MKRITKLEELSGKAPTVISSDTEVEVPGCYIDWDGNKGEDGTSTGKGARWTLRQLGTEARIRDLVIG